MQVDVNLWAVLVVSIASIFLGFLWYGPLFGKKWAVLSGLAVPEEKPPFRTMLKPIVLSLIGGALMSVVLSAGIAQAGVMTGMLAGFFGWIGFIVPAYLNLSGWEGKPWSLFFINTGYWLVYLLIAGAVLASWA
ncbi:MAG: DUF1761 domain-containing protein [Candidatus Taylorbacteria bacterium]|nr:DUF1761 domain-containing protein [Candidatus Taylorbacteria bacterium]